MRDSLDWIGNEVKELKISSYGKGCEMQNAIQMKRVCVMEKISESDFYAFEHAAINIFREMVKVVSLFMQFKEELYIFCVY